MTDFSFRNSVDSIMPLIPFILVPWIILTKKRIPKLKETQEEIQLQARSNSIPYKITYFGKRRRGVPALTVSIPITNSPEFRMTRRTQLDHFFSKLGWTQELQIGNPDIDQVYLIEATDRLSMGSITRKPAFYDAIKNIFKSKGYDQIQCIKNNLSMSIAGEANPERVSKDMIQEDLQCLRQIQQLVENQRHVNSSSISLFSALLTMPILGSSFFLVGFFWFILELNGTSPLFALSEPYFTLGILRPFATPIVFVISTIITIITILIVKIRFRSGIGLHRFVFHRALPFVFVGIALIVYCVLIRLNESLDTQSETTKTYEITSKIYERTRSAKRVHFLAVRNPDSLKKPMLLRVSSEEYSRCQSGSSKLEITTRPGAFGIEWITRFQIK